MKNGTYIDSRVGLYTTFLLVTANSAEYDWGSKDVHGRMGAIMMKARCYENSDSSKLNELLDYILGPLNKSINKYPEECQEKMRATLKEAMDYAINSGWADSWYPCCSTPT